MNKSTHNVIHKVKKRMGRPPTGQMPLMALRIPENVTFAIDKWRESQPDPIPSRSETIRVALADWLIGLGLLKHRDDPEGSD